MTTKKRILKILSALSAFALIALLLLITSALRGNPISMIWAKIDIRAYVEETYPDRNFIIDRPRYSFKTGGYYASVTDPESPDTIFSVFWEGGDVQYDNYSYEVEEKNSTLRRFSEAYDRAVTEAVEREFPYEIELCYGDLQMLEAWPELELDMPFSMNEIPGGNIVVWIVEPEPDWNKMAESLLILDEIMRRNGIPVLQYSLSLRLPLGENEEWMGEGLSIFEYPSSKIEKEDLPNQLEKFYHDWQQENEKNDS
ncbi:MAG: hypothetical protein ACOX6P_06825 [Candidatus Merdivicinus sp.]|jgi:hypothetical protein